MKDFSYVACRRNRGRMAAVFLVKRGVRMPRPVLCPIRFAPLLFSLLLSSFSAAAAQEVKLSNDSLNFLNQVVGLSSSAQSVVVTNTDTITPLAISRIAISGDYTQTNDCSSPLAPNSSCTISIRFKPNATGTLAGTVTLSDDAGDSPQLISLSGTGVAVTAAKPNALSFGTVSVGASSSKTITLTNNLKKAVTISVATSGDYTAVGNGGSPCPLAGGLAASSSCTLAVTFEPTFAGSISGVLSVSQNVTPTPQIISLSGTGSGGATPPLTFSPASVSFTSTVLGASSSTQITVTNSGATTVTVSAFSGSADFQAQGGSSSPCGGALGAGKKCTILVTFSPTAVGVIPGALTITATGSIKTQTVKLSGAGVAAVTVSPASLTFASQNQGVVSAAQAVTVTNNLKTTINLSTHVSGEYGVRTSGTNRCGTTLAAGASCLVRVFFNPIGRTGSIAGALTVSTNTNSGPQVVSLTGSATGLLPRFAYVANSTETTVSMYTVNASSGQLQHNGYVVSGNEPISVVVHPSNKFAYVINFTDGNIVAYAIGNDGRLTQIGSPLATGSLPFHMAITPSGSFIYVANLGDETVSAYAVNLSSGALTEVGGSPFATGAATGPTAIAVAPSGNFAYVANPHDNSISAFTINSGSGTLTAVKGSPFSTGEVDSFAMDPLGEFLIVVDTTGKMVSTFGLNSSTGALSSLSSTASDSPNRAAVDNSGRFLYVSNENSQEITAYSINRNTGALTQIAGSPFATLGESPLALTIDPANRFLYVEDLGSAEVDVFSINAASGALTFLKPVTTRNGPFSIALANGVTPVINTPRFAYMGALLENAVLAFEINSLSGALLSYSAPYVAGGNPDGLAVDRSGRFLYSANVVGGDEGVDTGSIWGYSIDPTEGLLSSVILDLTTASREADVAVDPSGRFAYVTNVDSDNVSAYSIDPSTGTLSSISGSPFAAGRTCGPLAVDPSGRFVYVSNEDDGNVSGYSVDPSTGALSQIPGSPFAAGGNPFIIAVDSSGRFAYVVNLKDNTVSGYNIGANGVLSPIPGSPFGTGQQPEGIALDPLGHFAYVINDVDNTISAYSIDPTTGALSPIPNSPFATGERPIAIALDPSGRFVYVSNSLDADVSGYSINPTTGALSPVPGSPFPAVALTRAVVTVGLIH